MPLPRDGRGSVPHDPALSVRTTVHPVVWGACFAIVAIEALFWIGEPGPGTALRYAAYGRLAVGAIPPLTALQHPVAGAWFLAGLVGHALLHAGWLHVMFNTVGLLCLGHVVQAQAGTARFLGIFAATAVAGAVVFLLLAGGNIMVGASGAVFGLLGAVLRWRARPVALWRVLLVLVLLSVPAGLLVGGPVAWQAHLGGFLAGWALGRVVPVTRRIVHPLM